MEASIPLQLPPPPPTIQTWPNPPKMKLEGYLSFPLSPTPFVKFYIPTQIRSPWLCFGSCPLLRSLGLLSSECLCNLEEAPASPGDLSCHHGKWECRHLSRAQLSSLGERRENHIIHAHKQLVFEDSQ